MSRLYIRMLTSFYSHRKTLRLKTKIGNDAFWVVPRMWAYAAENQPDGNLSDYTAQEIAMLIAYTGDAQALLEALKCCGFIDLDGCIHGWNEHNGYHQKFSERAKIAAEARWSKKEKNQKKEDTDKDKESGDKHCSSIAKPMLQASIRIPDSLKRPDFEVVWNEWMVLRMAGKKVSSWEKLFQKQLMWLSQFKPHAAIEVLEQSMRNGWQGLFEPKEGGSRSDTGNQYNMTEEEMVRESMK